MSKSLNKLIHWSHLKKGDRLRYKRGIGGWRYKYEINFKNETHSNILWLTLTDNKTENLIFFTGSMIRRIWSRCQRALHRCRWSKPTSSRAQQRLIASCILSIIILSIRIVSTWRTPGPETAARDGSCRDCSTKIRTSKAKALEILLSEGKFDST